AAARVSVAADSAEDLVGAGEALQGAGSELRGLERAVVAAGGGRAGRARCEAGAFSPGASRAGCVLGQKFAAGAGFAESRQPWMDTQGTGATHGFEQRTGVAFVASSD